ncbi:MAG: acyl-ACP--UDP-N-acetylglucosamine O-acyltransferase, partial [Planctomycetia bacterium]
VGRGTRLVSHVVLRGRVTLGEDNELHPFVVVGGEPQDLGYHGEPTAVEIGDRNVFREAVTVHRGTTKENRVTRIGSDNFLMGATHVGHDGVIGSHCVFGNGCLLAGHVHVHDYANLSGGVGVHHFITIAGYSFIGGLSKVVTDVPPYMMMQGNPAEAHCVNLVGLKRRGFSTEEINTLIRAHRLLFRKKIGVEQSREVLKAAGDWSAPVATLFDYLDEQRLGRKGRARERLRAA